MSELAEVSPPARPDHRVWRFVTGFAAIIASASLATGAYYVRENAKEQHRQVQELILANCISERANLITAYGLPEGTNRQAVYDWVQPGIEALCYSTRDFPAGLPKGCCLPKGKRP